MVEKKQFVEGGKDMINKIELKLSDDSVLILVDKAIKLKVSVKNKTINTNDIFKLLNYDVSKIYKLDCKKFDEKELKGSDGENKRLFNYLFDLFDQIILDVNNLSKEFKG